MSPRFSCRAVLFDLDGTLIDSAPDLAGAANQLREQHALPPLPLNTLRPWVGAGARGMLGQARAIDEAGCPVVACARVDLVEFDQ